MFIDKSYTLKLHNYKRIMFSDNYSTHISLSDMKYEFDGLWSHGYRVFSGFSINGTSLSDKKVFNPFSADIFFTKGIKTSLTLLKNNQGLILDTGKSGYKTEHINGRRYRSVTYDFQVTDSCTYHDTINNTVYLKYTKPQRDGFGVETLYVAFTTDQSFTIHYDSTKTNRVSISIRKTSSNNKSPFLYILYGPSLEQLQPALECNRDSQDVLFKQHINNVLLPLKYTGCKTGNKLMNKALTYSVLSGSSFIMSKNGQLGIWAGFPWFDNGWGRDTFISLPGITLVTGRYEIASHIIGNFLKYQNTNQCSKDYGKIPNVIFSEDNIKYNTADGTPLLIRELYEYFLYTGDASSVMSVWHNVITAIDEVYFTHKDVNYFMPGNDADDWMDARIMGQDSYSPRGDRQVEIQALWYTALYAVVNIADEIIQRHSEYKPLLPGIDIAELEEKRQLYKSTAEKLKTSFRNHFITDKTPFIYDHINKDGSPDMKIRPNVMLAAYYSDLAGIPQLIDDNSLLKAFKIIVNNCAFEHGIASLGKYDGDFHPLHITPQHHKDAAYHNGAIWGWLSGAFVYCATRFGLQNFSFRHTRKLMHELINGATPGTISELFEPYSPDNEIHASGAYSQAWSVAEFARSFYQNYLGIRPDVPHRKLYITPAFPAKLDDFNVTIRYGITESINIDIKVNKSGSNISFIEVKALDIQKPLEVGIRLNTGPGNDVSCTDYKIVFLRILLKSTGSQVRADFDFIEKNRMKLRDLFISNNSELIAMGTDTVSFCEHTLENIDYVKPLTNDDLMIYKSITHEHYLDKKILGDNFDVIERFK